MTGDAAGLQLVPTTLELGLVEFVGEDFEQAAAARARTEIAATAMRRCRADMCAPFDRPDGRTEPKWRSPVVRSTERVRRVGSWSQVTRTGMRAGSGASG